jgi:hypothetical protein
MVLLSRLLFLKRNCSHLFVLFIFPSTSQSPKIELISQTHIIRQPPIDLLTQGINHTYKPHQSNVKALHRLTTSSSTHQALHHGTTTQPADRRQREDRAEASDAEAGTSKGGETGTQNPKAAVRRLLAETEVDGSGDWGLRQEAQEQGEEHAGAEDPKDANTSAKGRSHRQGAGKAGDGLEGHKAQPT